MYSFTKFFDIQHTAKYWDCPTPCLPGAFLRGASAGRGQQPELALAREEGHWRCQYPIQLLGYPHCEKTPYGLVGLLGNLNPTKPSFFFFTMEKCRHIGSDPPQTVFDGKNSPYGFL